MLRLELFPVGLERGPLFGYLLFLALRGWPEFLQFCRDGFQPGFAPPQGPFHRLQPLEHPGRFGHPLPVGRDDGEFAAEIELEGPLPGLDPAPFAGEDHHPLECEEVLPALLEHAPQDGQVAE